MLLSGKSHHAPSATKFLPHKAAETSSRCSVNSLAGSCLDHLHLVEQIRDSYNRTQIFTTLLFHQCPSAVKSFPQHHHSLVLLRLISPAPSFPASRPKYGPVIGQHPARNTLLWLAKMWRSFSTQPPGYSPLFRIFISDGKIKHWKHSTVHKIPAFSTF